MGPRRAGLDHPQRREGARRAQTRVREEGGRRASLWLNPLYSESSDTRTLRGCRERLKAGFRGGLPGNSEQRLLEGGA